MAAIKEVVGESAYNYLIARQPIVDRELALAGYELLYRAGSKHEPDPVSGDMATARVISTTLSESGLEELVGDGTAFINMTRESIFSIDLLSLPTHKVVFEILEHVEIDDELRGKIDQLIDSGYRFALDDFNLNGIHRGHIGLASVVKVDVLELSREEIAEHVKLLRRYPVKLVAEKVETWEDFEYCKDLGFDLFQGFFFAKPQLMHSKRPQPNRSATYRLISRLNEPNVGFDELEQLVCQDPGLTFKLFRYVNSAMVARNRTFSNLRQVIILLGIDRLRAIATMFAMCQLDLKPPALTRMLLQRAQLCRLLAEKQKAENPDNYFTMGMFSLIDAFMDQPIHDGIAGIPLPDEIRAAILSHDGEMGRVLVKVIQMERRSCDQVEEALEGDQADYMLYNEAAHWAIEAVRVLEEVAGG